MYSSAVEINPSVKTIVWDLDGTLLDSFGILRDCLNQTLLAHGRAEVPEPILRLHHHGFINDSIANAIAATGQKVSPDELLSIVAGFYELDNTSIKDVDHHLFEDAVELGLRAHTAGKKQILVTNRPHGIDRGNGSPRNLVQNSRLHRFIGDVLCGDDSEYRKPHRQFLEARYGSELSDLGEILVIGDQFVDAEFAHNLGARAILIGRAGPIAHLDRLEDKRNHYDQVGSATEIVVI